MIRLLKPLSYYWQKYGAERYGMNKLYLMMEKQHNRGQEGAGIACVDMDAPVGTEYMFRERAEGKDAITRIFSNAGNAFAGQLYMGHLRYSTTGRHGLQYVHPFLRRNNWRARNLCICGNFNMTNMDEVFDLLCAQGQSPRIRGDGYIALELMGHRLDREVERLYGEARRSGLDGIGATRYIDDHLDVANMLKTAMKRFDGGYVMCGMTGSGEMFAVRDPWGIRTAWYYRNDEMVVLASERPVIQTCFDLDAGDVAELQPGQAIIVRKDGSVGLEQIILPRLFSACSFERIYFSRGSDMDIYLERKRLGEQLAEPVLEAVGHDVAHTVFSFIPNTAEVAFCGMADALRKRFPDVRTEKVVWKDIKLRTFIAEGAERNDLAAHVYDVTYGCLVPHEDCLVVMDDSIVRGTTLRESILKMLDRLHPRKIVVVSSAPQIRYPDCYGIDMSHLEELCAFRAVVALIRERNMQQLLTDTYRACREELLKPLAGLGETGCANCVEALYAPFTVSEINRQMARMLCPEGMRTPVELVFQSVDGLHRACRHHPGDWYFTGRYPTPGGMRMVNQAFVDYMDRNDDNLKLT